MGYGTAQHRAGIDELGLTPHHRLSFGGLQFKMEL
jgi:ribonuclease HII